MEYDNPWHKRGELNAHNFITRHHVLWIAIGRDNHTHTREVTPLYRWFLATDSSDPLKQFYRRASEPHKDRLTFGVPKAGVVFKYSNSLWALRGISGHHETSVQKPFKWRPALLHLLENRRGASLLNPL
jgi:hypothetical protein